MKYEEVRVGMVVRIARLGEDAPGWVRWALHRTGKVVEIDTLPPPHKKMDAPLVHVDISHGEASTWAYEPLPFRPEELDPA